MLENLVYAESKGKSRQSFQRGEVRLGSFEITPRCVENGLVVHRVDQARCWGKTHRLPACTAGRTGCQDRLARAGTGERSRRERSWDSDSDALSPSCPRLLQTRPR